MAKKLRAAVIGVGSLGQHHARIYHELADVELVAVADTNPEQRRAVSERWGVPGLADWRELSGRIDVASVAVPTSLHYEIARELLAQGVHLLLEKPIATSLVEADELVELAEKAGVVLQVGHLERFNPAFVAARPLIERPLFVECSRLGRFAPRVADVDVVLDLMIHDIDLLLSWTGAPVRHVRAVGIPVLSDEIDMASAWVEMADGCVASLTASRVSFEPCRKIRIFQASRYISIDTLRREVHAFEKAGAAGAVSGDPMASIRPLALAIEDAEPLKVEIEGFAAAVRERRPPEVSGATARRALDLALRIKDCIRENLGRVSRATRRDGDARFSVLDEWSGPARRTQADQDA